MEVPFKTEINLTKTHKLMSTTESLIKHHKFELNLQRVV